MLEFRLEQCADMLSRLTGAPQKARAKYLRRIERLLEELDPSRQYPFDYIRYRIIGYCIDQDTGSLFQGGDLQADLTSLATEIRPLTLAAKLEKAKVGQQPKRAEPADLEPEPAYIFEPAFEDDGFDKLILRLGGDSAKACGGRLLRPDEEKNLFRCYNYCKFKVTHLTRQIADSLDRFSVVEEVNFYKGVALQCRNAIIEANIGLVNRATIQHVGRNLAFEELLSDGNNSLIRAVENFDYRKGNRFSTYSTWVITKNFARSIPLENLLRKSMGTDSEAVLETQPENEKKYKTRLLPRLWKTIEEALEKLPEKERIAVTYFFGVHGAPISLREIAPKLGIKSKELVRTYKDRGLRHLEEILDSELYEEIYT